MSAEGTSGAGMPAEWRLIKAELAAHQWDSLDQAEAFLTERIARYNAEPQPELGGLSPNEMRQLLDQDWKRGGPLRLDDALTLDQVTRAPLLHTSRSLLAAAAERNGIKATATGNLNRRFVATVIDPADWPDTRFEDILAYSNVINELDVWPLHSLRVVLQRAGLLARRKGAFRATRTGRDLMEEPRAGTLYAHLFRTFFRDFNLAYLSAGGDDRVEANQPLVPVVLLRLATLDRSWRRVHDLAPILIPGLDPDPEKWGFSDDAARLAYAFFTFRLRFLAPLEWFGLLEGRSVPSAVRFMPFRELRRTPLFDTFIRFDPAFLRAARRGMG
ncbi:MAG TPA: hypothetical protein VF970_13900 [Gemmatimonadales bacterium]